ncbi:hypothetical protein [Variovorax sp. UMC13]|uniref:hypothetical protein n=1 Tax=Variovorax sp. UMC13 TaxID=1862326 RepID=UPI0015FF043D|nr:hypothetical protein [Variovorax sp. UMC13]
MTMYTDRVFRNETVNVDDNTYERCEFEFCRIVYAGGPAPRLLKNNFESCEFVLDGAAGRTLAYIRGLYLGGARDLAEDFITAIRTPDDELPPRDPSKGPQR